MHDRGPGIGRALERSLDLVGNALGNVDRLIATVVSDGRQIAEESQALFRTAAGRAGLVRDTVRATPRMIRIVSEGMKIIAAYRIHRARSRHISEDRAAARLEALHRSSARRLYRLCVELRGGVLKLGQFLSCRMDLLPHAYIEELSALQDQVPPVPTEEIVARLEDELGQPLDELFAAFDDEPIAAASLAQVHRAVLPDGRAVAVKVQVPGIEEIIESDIAALSVLAGAAGDLVPQTDLPTITTELARSIREELDFTSEADNLVTFRAAFEGDDDVVVPEPIEIYTTERVVTMELLEGRKLTDYLDDAAERGAEGVAETGRVFEILIRAFCQQVLEDGRFHADPHPGNFMVLPGPRLAILDFGSVAVLSPETRAAYARIAGAVLARDTERMAALLADLGFETRNGGSDTLIEIAEMMLELFRDGAVDIESIDPREQLERALEIARDNPVVTVPVEFVLLGRVFGALGGLVMHYKPKIELFRIIAPHLSRAMAAARASA
jgi:ubiquinone biosynthesis protein